MKLKSRHVKIGICILIFFSFIAVSNRLLRPVYDRIGSQIQAYMGRLSLDFKEKYGLIITYGSLSPSILRGIDIRHVTIVDAKSSAQVASIQALFLRYSLKELLRGNIDGALKTLTIREVDVFLGREENDFWLKGILERRAEKKSGEKERSSSPFSLDRLMVSAWPDVRIYRLNFKGRAGGVTVETAINRAVLTSSSGLRVDANVQGDFSVLAAGQKIGGTLNFQTSVPVALDGSSAVLRFSNFSSGEYKMRYIGFLAEYASRKFTVKMLPSAQNIYTELSCDLESGDVLARLFADGFSLSRLVQTSRKDKLTRDIFSLNFSVQAEGLYNFRTKEKSYKSSGDIFIPERVFPSKKYASDVSLGYSVAGDEKYINIPFLKTSGEKYNLSFEGGFNFQTKQPDGNLFLESIVLPNGGEISAEVYMESLENGFMCFSPQVRFDQKILTAAQLSVLPTDDSWDFTFEVSDYLHAEEPGTVSIFGSYAPQQKSMQTSVSFDTIFLDSIVGLYAFFAEPNLKPLLEGAANVVKDFVFSGDAFGSGLGKNYSFNIPYAIVASTVRDDQMLILAADGNRESIQLSRLEFVFGGQRLSMNGESESLEQGGRMLNGRLELNDIPYNFSGLVNKNWISLNSEYGLQFTMGTDTSGPKAIVKGSFSMAGFPLNLGGRTYSITTDSSFTYSVDDGINVSIPIFDGRLLEGSSRLNPSIAFSGDITNSGFYFDSIAYSDTVSTLNGNGSIIWLYKERDFQGASFKIALSNSLGLENITLSGDLSNPLKTSLEVGTLVSGEFFRNIFFTLNFDIEALRSERFVADSRESDTVNAKVSMQGNMDNPFVTLSVPHAVFTPQKTPLVLSAEATVEDRVVSVQNASVDYGATQVEGVTALFDLSTWNGRMDFALRANLFKKHLSTRVSVTAEALSEVTRGIPESLSVSVDTDEVHGMDSKHRETFHVGVIKMKDDLILSSSENIGLSGMVSNYRDVEILVNNPMPFKMKIDGQADRENLALAFTEIDINLSKLLKSCGIDMVNVSRGDVTGAFVITGPLSNPAFSGSLDVVPAEFNFQDFFTKKASTEKLTLLMSGSQFYTEPTRCHLHKSPVDIAVNVQMNRLAFESLEVTLKTVEDSYVPLNMNLSEMHVKGDFKADLMISFENRTIGVSGNLTAKNTNAEFGATRLNEIISGFTPASKEKEREEEEDSEISVDVSLHIKTETRVQISYTTFLRAVIVPGSEIDVTYFGDQDRLLLEGDVPIRFGEIIYLNSNFYIKEGEIHFSDNDESFDPRITIQAETKTRDVDNESVTVYLSVDNQHLSELSPRLSASPAKSEREIMEILGAIVTANSEDASGLALAAGDYALQTVIVRRLENALRDFFNFDIFSVRTMVVQNAVKQGMRNSSDSSNSAGNYLDGTTVYIGKYFSDSLFADGMLRLDYDENRHGDYTYDGLSFRPELGFELESPFAKIRWSMSPDFEALRNLKLVENTALTLSWKLNF